MTGEIVDGVIRAGTSARDGWDLAIDPERAGWSFSGLRVLTLGAGQVRSFDTGSSECILLPLEGAYRVVVDGREYELRGRTGVFSSPTDSLFVPRDSSVVVTSDLGGRLAIPSSLARTRHPLQYVPAEAVPIERRGGGAMSRLVRDFGGVGTITADRLISCEVITPGGNWSSYPPHKHDVESHSESELEEIYYFEVADGPGGPGLAYQRVSASDERPIDVFAEVRSGDTVTIPYGWHGPSMASPGHDLYYLNVMAGPGATRQWKITDEPSTGWIRSTWSELGTDPRLDSR